MAAQRFLTKHDLPDSYSEQVVEFIHKNTEGVQLGTGDQNTFVDPFTGASRYTGSSGASGGAGGSFGGDPFTGACLLAVQGTRYTADDTQATEHTRPLPERQHLLKVFYP